MEAVFLKVLNMSLTASYVILAVLLVRLLLHRAPKKYSYALWSVVAFRLCCPVSFRAVFSLLSLLRLNRAAAEPAMTYIPQNIGMMAQPEITVGIPAADAALSASLPAAEPAASANPMQIWVFLGMVLWCAGMAAMLLYAVVSYARLHHRLRTAVWMEGNVWQSERVCSPFILGVFRPRIYIPFGLGDETRGYVLAHERFHLRRLDHIVRPFAFLLLTVHWFNPLCHLAFVLMTRDMEMRCDEQVLSGGEGRSKPYSLSLLAFASNRRLPSPGPLAFGESGVKARIRNILHWKQPKRWVTVLAAVLCVAVLAACAANPTVEPEPPLKDGDPTVNFFFNLEPGETVWLADPVELTEESSDVAFQISYEQMGLTVDIGLVAEDGTTYGTSVTGGSANQAIERLPAGVYAVFLRNSEVNLQYAETATEPLTVTGAIALTWPGLEASADGEVRRDAASYELPETVAVLGGPEDAERSEALYHAVMAAVEENSSRELVSWMKAEILQYAEDGGEVQVWVLLTYADFEYSADGLDFTITGLDRFPVFLRFDTRMNSGTPLEYQEHAPVPEDVQARIGDPAELPLATWQDICGAAVELGRLDGAAIVGSLFDELEAAGSTAETCLAAAPEAHRELLRYGYVTLREVCASMQSGADTRLRGELQHAVLDELTVDEGLAQAAQELLAEPVQLPAEPEIPEEELVPALEIPVSEEPQQEPSVVELPAGEPAPDPSAGLQDWRGEEEEDVEDEQAAALYNLLSSLSYTNPPCEGIPEYRFFYQGESFAIHLSDRYVWHNGMEASLTEQQAAAVAAYLS